MQYDKGSRFLVTSDIVSGHVVVYSQPLPGMLIICEQFLHRGKILVIIMWISGLQCSYMMSKMVTTENITSVVQRKP